jgi:heme A synthase
MQPPIASPTTHQRHSLFARLAWGVLGFNLLVILWGAFVRASGSGAGCGNHWPLCNGEVVPHNPAVTTLIEFGHRLTSGLALILVGALAAGAWRGFPRRHPVRLAAGLSVLFIVAEALVGAGLVLLHLVADNASPARGYWVAGHLLNTLLLVACLTLTARWASGGAALRLRGHGLLPVLLALTFAGVLVLGMSGAVTALGDTLFPTTTLADAEAQTFSPSAHLFVRLRVWHPALALAVGIGVVAAGVLALRGSTNPTARNLAIDVIGLYAVQLLIGALTVGMLAPLALQIIHLLFADVVWIALVLFAASVLASEPAA